MQKMVEKEESQDSRISIGYTRINGLQVRYAESGSGHENKALMLHGGGISTGYTSWSKIMPVIGEEYHVIAPDMPGYGRSKKPKKHTTLNYYADFTENFMKHMDIKRADIIAESFGGGIALKYALDHKEKVKSLALIDSYGFFNKKFPLETYLLTRINANVQYMMIKQMVKSDIMASAVLKSLLRGTGPTPGEIKFVQNYVAQHGPTVACLQFVQSEITRHGARSDFTNRIPELNEMGIPILFVHGTRDPLFPIENQKKAAAQIKNAKFVPIEAAHQPEETDPKTVIVALLNHLKRSA